ncbi:lipoteichoic acid stability factor AuxB [Staphylococcus parequorum]|uniref:lipoteichoic acid stability factor AuxB n=1 Tax=unclassified Staphylococcus TaxID=91994 RepID=UPI00336631AE
MSGEQYTQVRRPVSRLAEKVLGWLSWIFLLLLTIITMFIALVSFSSEASIQNLETSLNGNDFVQQILANNGLNTIQFVIWLQNGVWAIIVYFIVCLLLSFLALISMNIRILSGFLFLIATIVTLPLVLLFVPLIIPILFLIVAIMMFARKEKVETVPAYYAEGYQGRYSNYEQQSEPNSPQYIEKQQTSDVEQQSNDNQLRRGGYSSEVAEKVNSENNASDEEPQVLSRQAKYNYKQRKHNNVDDDSQSTEDDFGQVSNVYNEDGEAVANEDQSSKDAVTKEQQEQQAKETELENQRIVEEEQRRKQEAYEAQQRKQAEQEEQQRRKQEEAEEAARLKQEKAEEKARIKQEKKERRKREKEKRKQQPSAANQRRKNFEERKKMTSQDVEETQDTTSEEQNDSETKDKS